MRALVLAAGFAAVACAPVHLGSAAADQRAIYAIESDYDAALKVAIAYKHSPAADPKIVAALVAAEKAATKALATAEKVSRANSPEGQVLAAVQDARDDVGAFVALARTVR